MKKSIVVVGLLMLLAVNLEAGRLQLQAGCYKISTATDNGACSPDYIPKVLVDGKKETSSHVAVARWWGAPKVEITFDLKDEYKVNNIKVYTTIGTDQRIKTISVLASSDGSNYREVTKKENPDTSPTYPEPQLIDIPFLPTSAKYLRLILEQDPNYKGMQVSEVEVYQGEGAVKTEKMPQGEITANLLTNPGFEEDKDKDNIPDGWAPNVFEGQGNPKMSYEEGRGKGKAVAIYTPGNTDAGCWRTTIPVNPHTGYKLSFWYKTSGEGQPEVLFFGDHYLSPTPPNQWREMVIWADSGSAEKVDLTLLLYHRPDRKVWFDDLKVSEMLPDSAELYYYKDDAYVSPDMPVLFALGGRNFGGRGGELKFEVPEGIKLAGVWDTHQSSDREFTSKEIKRNHKPYTQYTIPLPRISSYPEMAHLFLTTTWEEGKEGKVYFWIEWPGGRQEEEVVTFHAIRIPKAKAPKRIYTGFNLYGEVLGNTWPNFLDNFQCLGMNTLCLSSTNFTNPDTGPLDNFIQEGLKRKLTMVCGYAPFVTAQGISKEEDAQAMNIDGKRIPNKCCPSYRGTLFQSQLRLLDNIPRHRTNWIDWDEEMYWGANELCFCDRCRSDFKKWLTKNHPEIGYVDPIVFEKDRANNQILHNAWVDYKSDLVTEWYQIFADQFRKLAPGGIVSAYMTEGITPENTLHDLAKLAFPLDFIGQSCYIDWGRAVSAEGVAKFIQNTIQKADGHAKVIAVLTAGEMCGGDRGGMAGKNLESIELKYEILEALTSGAVGFTFYKFSHLDGLDFKYIAEGVNLIQPVEDILLEGKIRDMSQGKTNMRIIEKGDEAVLFVSSYVEERLNDMLVNYNVKENSVIADLNSGILKKFDIPASSFKINFGKESAQIFYIGPEIKYRQRMAQR